MPPIKKRISQSSKKKEIKMPPIKKGTPQPSNPTNKFVHPAADRWNVVWDTMAKQLLKYKEEHRHCLVPQRYAPDPKLGRWVNKQREQRDNLSPERKEILDSMGFVWTVVHRESWKTMFERLVAYKKKYKDCLVPQRFKEDPRLGGWVREQRKNKDNISAERKKLLDSIGFAWRARRLQEPSNGPSSSPHKSNERGLQQPVGPEEQFVRVPMPRMPPIMPSPYYQETLPPPSNMFLRQQLRRMIRIEQEREIKANLCILELLKRRRAILTTRYGAEKHAAVPLSFACNTVHGITAYSIHSSHAERFPQVDSGSRC